jgi:hypothetical protein
MLTSSRCWVSGNQIHLLNEEITNQWNATSLEEIPGAAWTRGRIVFEMIRNEQGAFMRMKRPSGWEEMVEQCKQGSASEGNGGELHILDPEAWQETRQPDSWLANYSLTVDADENLKSNLSAPGTIREPGRFALVRDDSKHSLAWELIYDPITGIKKTERRWTGDRLASLAQWSTTQAIAAAQFQIPERDLQAWRSRFGEKSGGLGLVFKSGQPVGPFTVDSVLPDSAAAAARIEPGSMLVAIDGRKTEGMQKDAAADLIRGLPGTRVTIGIKDPQTGITQTLELERRLLTPPGTQPPRNH